MNDLNLSAWISRRKADAGPHASYIIRFVVAYEKQIRDLRETNRLLHRRTQEAESTAYRNAGRWKRKVERLLAYAWMVADRRLAWKNVAQARVKDLEAQLAAATDRLQDGE